MSTETSGSESAADMAGDDTPTRHSSKLSLGSSPSVLSGDEEDTRMDEEDEDEGPLTPTENLLEEEEEDDDDEDEGHIFEEQGVGAGRLRRTRKTSASTMSSHNPEEEDEQDDDDDDEEEEEDDEDDEMDQDSASSLSSVPDDFPLSRSMSPDAPGSPPTIDTTASSSSSAATAAAIASRKRKQSILGADKDDQQRKTRRLSRDAVKVNGKKQQQQQQQQQQLQQQLQQPQSQKDKAPATRRQLSQKRQWKSDDDEKSKNDKTDEGNEKPLDVPADGNDADDDDDDDQDTNPSSASPPCSNNDQDASPSQDKPKDEEKSESDAMDAPDTAPQPLKTEDDALDASNLSATTNLAGDTTEKDDNDQTIKKSASPDLPSSQPLTVQSQQQQQDEQDEEKRLEHDRDHQQRHKEALEALTHIEEEFARLRDKMYQEKMAELNEEALMIANGTHPELLTLMTEIEEKKRRRIDTAEAWRKYQHANFKRQYEGFEYQANVHFISRKNAMRRDLLMTVNDKRWKIEDEHYELNDSMQRPAGSLMPDLHHLRAQKQHRQEESMDLQDIKEWMGFPRAPRVPGLSTQDVHDDLMALGLPAASHP